MKKLILCIFIIFGDTSYAQHSPVFSQYMVNGMAISPAYTGSREALAASLIYRQQWIGIEGAPSTQTFSIHSALKKHTGLGLLLFNDKIGVTRKMGASINYAYRLLMGKSRLAFGVSGQYISTSSKWSQVYTGETTDPVFQNDDPTWYSPNAGAGIYFYNPKLYAGLSVPEFLTNEYNRNEFRKDNLNIYYTMGFISRLSKDVVLKPSTLIKYRQASPVQVDLNLNLYLKDLVELGISWRSGDAIVGLVQVNLNPQFKIGYSYDHSISALKKFNSGSHEFMLHYEFKYKSNAINPRYF